MKKYLSILVFYRISKIFTNSDINLDIGNIKSNIIYLKITPKFKIPVRIMYASMYNVLDTRVYTFNCVNKCYNFLATIYLSYFYLIPGYPDQRISR